METNRFEQALRLVGFDIARTTGLTHVLRVESHQDIGYLMLWFGGRLGSSRAHRRL